MAAQIQPAGPPPVGTLSNFADPLNMAPNLIACNVVLLIVSVLIVVARILSRTVLTDWRLGWDDCLSSSSNEIVAMSLLTYERYDTRFSGRDLKGHVGDTIFIQSLGRHSDIHIFRYYKSVIPSLGASWRFMLTYASATNYGLGRHMWDVPMETYTPNYLWVSAMSLKIDLNICLTTKSSGLWRLSQPALHLTTL